MISSTRIPRCEVVDLCETIYADGPLPVFGPRVLGLYLCVRLTPISLRHSLSQGATRRDLRRPAGHYLTDHESPSPTHP